MKDRVLLCAIIMAALIAWVTIISCDNPTTPDEAKTFLIGTWHGTKDDGSTFNIYFSNENTFTLSGLDKSVNPVAAVNLSGSYRVDTVYIYIKPAGVVSESLVMYNRINNTVFTTIKPAGDYQYFNGITFHR